MSDRCKQCGAALTERDAFCTKCGAQLGSASEPATQRFCTKCGAPLLGETKFCTKCGAAAGVGSNREKCARFPERSDGRRIEQRNG